MLLSPTTLYLLHITPPKIPITAMRKGEEGAGSSKGIWAPFTFIHCLLSIIWPSNQLPIGASTVNDREEGANNGIGSKWSEIEDDVLAMVLKRLSPIDCLRAQNVCLSWRSTISKLINCENGIPSPEIPLALFNMPKMKHFSFFNLSTQSVFSYIADSSTKLFQNKILCLGTVEGWVIMNEFVGNFLTYNRIFFLNPVTKTKVYMRPTFRDRRGREIVKIIASTKPTDPNCVVACLFLNPHSFAFSFISDQSWTLVEGDSCLGINFGQAEIFGGKLYALTDGSCDKLVVCDLRSKPVKPQVLAKLPTPRRALTTPEVDDGLPFPAVVNILRGVYKYLAIDASSKELLLVYSFFSFKSAHTPLLVCPLDITRISVFKLDNIISGKLKWIEIKNLENRILYISCTKSMVVSTDDIHGLKESTKGNYIYFASRFSFGRIANMEPWDGIIIGRQHKSDESISYYKFEKTDMTNIVLSPIWFVPHIAG